MYYDLVASLPHLKHFAAADHSPITRLKLIQRLKRLEPEHIQQLQRVRPLVAWRPEQMVGREEIVVRMTTSALNDSSLDRSLRQYLALRVDQKMLLAAARTKRAGRELPTNAQDWGGGTRLHLIRRNWTLSDFGLAKLYPWFPKAQALLDSNDARGLEQLLMENAWRWLKGAAEQNMFGFTAVFSYVFRWDIQQAWLSCNAADAKSRFSELIDKVTSERLN